MVERKIIARQTSQRQSFAFDHHRIEIVVFADDDELAHGSWWLMFGGRRVIAGVNQAPTTGHQPPTTNYLPSTTNHLSRQEIDDLNDVNEHQRQHQRGRNDV